MLVREGNCEVWLGWDVAEDALMGMGVVVCGGGACGCYIVNSRKIGVSIEEDIVA
jgi:hypothetical protein